MNLTGQPTSDSLIGTGDPDTILGLAGNDYIVGGAGLDTLDGGSGDDVIFTGNTFVVVQGAPFGIPDSATFDDVIGGDGNDVILGYAKGDAGDGNDIIVGGGEFLFGGAGNDIFLGGAGHGGSGDDTYIISSAGNYTPLFDVGADRFVINGDFSGDVRLGYLFPGEKILEFLNIPGINSFADIEARTTRSSFETRIMIDADTSVYLTNDLFNSSTRPVIEFNQTDVAGLIGVINSKIAQAQNGAGFNDAATAFSARPDTAKGLAAVYDTLLDGVPNEAGFIALISKAVSTNFGAGPGPVFNAENIFINLANNLVQGNASARAAFDAKATGATLAEKIASIYQDIIPSSAQTPGGLAFLTRPEGIAFYQSVAAERGVAGTDGAAIVAMASLLRITVAQDIGIGNAVNDLIRAVAAGSDLVPASGNVFTDIEIADGSQFDADDGAKSSAVVANVLVEGRSSGHATDQALELGLVGVAEQVYL